jgi:murein DD-endopeptidase MepM/ murein hydrolase activator NlpD
MILYHYLNICPNIITIITNQKLHQTKLCFSEKAYYLLLAIAVNCKMKQIDIASVLEKHAFQFHPVIPFNRLTEKMVSLNLSKTNTAFTEGIYSGTDSFSIFIEQQRKLAGANYLIGGYRELREMYRRSKLFDTSLVYDEQNKDEPRSLHLGTDVWGDVGTKIFAALGGMVHSFAFNNNYGDYGATIILQHQLDMINFYSLYGHLSLKDLANIRKGQFITRGENFAHFGPPEENGKWPPHLHFQIILDMGNLEGDYPGVCKMSEAQKYLKNSPDPDLILKLNQFIL